MCQRQKPAFSSGIEHCLGFGVENQVSPDNTVIWISYSSISFSYVAKQKGATEFCGKFPVMSLYPKSKPPPLYIPGGMYGRRCLLGKKISDNMLLRKVRTIDRVNYRDIQSPKCSKESKFQWERSETQTQNILSNSTAMMSMGGSEGCEGICNDNNVVVWPWGYQWPAEMG